MTDSEVQSALSGKSALALTIWAEARAEPIEGQIAVGSVIRNRLLHWSQFRASEATYLAVCLAPKQFSCWSHAGGEKNYRLLMDLASKVVQGQPWKDAHLTQCMYLADGIISGVLIDNTSGATHYFAPQAMQPPYTEPSWAKGKHAVQIGSQLFLIA